MKRTLYLSTLLLSLVLCTSINAYGQEKSKSELRKEAKLAKEAKQLAFVDSLLKCRHFNFVAERTVAGLAGTNNSFSLNYGVSVEGNKVYSKLPFYGKMNTATIGSSQGPLDFESERISYKQEGQPKGKKEFATISIGIEPLKQNNQFLYVLEVYSSGSATLTIAQQNGDGAAFYGYITDVDADNMK